VDHITLRHSFPTRRSSDLKKKDTEEAVAKLPVLRPDAAGIDVGAKELWVSVPEDRDKQPVRQFLTFTHAVKAMIVWLQQCRIQRSEEHTSELQSRVDLVCR